MIRTNALVILLAMAGLVGAGCLDTTDDSKPTTKTPAIVGNNGIPDQGTGGSENCDGGSVNPPCGQWDDCRQIFGYGYCTDNKDCVEAPPFGLFITYHCQCLLSCDGKSCGEDNGCGTKCIAPCANGLECGLDTVGGTGCHDPKKCAGLPCGVVDDQGYSCNGSCAASSTCAGFDVLVYPPPLFEEERTLVYKCQCTPNCGNKSCNASDGCGGTCIDACPPDPCIALRRDVDLKISILDDGSWAGTATNTNKDTVTCEFMGDTITLTRILAPNQTVSDLSWPKETYSVFDVCFLSSGAAACFAEF